MKKIFTLLISLLVSYCSTYCQDEGVNLDLLKAPVSPASNLLGIAVSDIDKPTDVSAFMLSLRSATNNFGTLPTNYAIDVAPYWFFKKNTGDVTTAGLAESCGKDVFKQTLVLSVAIRNTDESETQLLPNNIYTGFGFKVSICRGDYDKTTINALNEIKKWQKIKTAAFVKKLDDYRTNADVIELRLKQKQMIKDALNDAVQDAINTGILSSPTQKQVDEFKRSILAPVSDSVMNSKDYTDIIDALEAKLTELQQEESTEANERIKEVAAAFQTARIGFTWDIAGGISGQFIDKRFDNSRVHNAGVWSTIGYTSETVGSFLGLLRLLHNPDQIFANDNAANEMSNITTFDFGGRYIYSKPQSKFNASLEGVYRSVLSSNTIKPSWRLIFNADYALWKNQKLTFSFGRNFDGTITKDGNLVAALSFLTGFGNKR